VRLCSRRSRSWTENRDPDRTDCDPDGDDPEAVAAERGAAQKIVILWRPIAMLTAPIAILSPTIAMLHRNSRPWRHDCDPAAADSNAAREIVTVTRPIAPWRKRFQL
jgi:hypothetical protein